MLSVEELIRASLRGENPPWPSSADDSYSRLFLTKSTYHGVQALLHHRFDSEEGQRLGWPDYVLGACRDSAIGQAMWEMRHRNMLHRVLTELSESGIRPILFKGTALAYDVYPAPFLRTRGDTDMIIPVCAREKTCQILESLGFECAIGVRGDLISYTAVYCSRDSNSNAHEIDLHWRISNSQALSKLFSYEELLERSRRVPALSSHAIAPSHADALLLACMHRAAHKEAPYFVGHEEHYGGDREIWLYDVHLLLGNFATSDFRVLLELAKKKGLGGVCLEAIGQARTYYGTIVPDEISRALRQMRQDDAASRFLSGSPAYRYYANFMAVDGARDKLQLLVEMLFPPRKYMLQLYSGVRPKWLPWLYLRRCAITIAKRLHRTVMNFKPSTD